MGRATLISWGGMLFGLYLLIGWGCVASEAESDLADRRVIGSHGTGPGEFYRPRAVTVAADGTFWVADMTGRIQSFDREGTHRQTIRLPEVERGRPTGLAIDREGNLLVAETHYSRIARYSPDGQLLERWGEYGKGPGQFILVTDLAVDASGNVFVSEQGERNDRIQKLGPDGSFILAFGRFGEGRGELRRPSAIACDGRGAVYVADTVNHRIQKFDEQGKFLASWGEPAKVAVAYITLDSTTGELDDLCAAIRTLKGRHEYTAFRAIDPN